jgi:hypothetical protein
MPRSPSQKMRMPLLSGVAALALLHAEASVAATVGTAGAANTRSTGTPPGSSLRVIEVGAQVVSDEKIETSATGSVQLLFIDKTTLNIGPNSSVVIDKFVFDPATAQGEMAISLGKGVLRVVGGQATHTGGASITTPVATIGLRGGILSLTHSPAEGTLAVLVFGALSMTSGGVTQTVSRPGFFVRAASAGSPPSTPAKASPALVDNLKNAVTSKGGQSGGSPVAPTEQQAAANNIGTSTSLAAPLQIIAQTQNTTRLNTVSSLADAIAQEAAQVTLSTPQAILPSPPAPSPLPPPPGATPAAYALVTTAGAGSSVPYLAASLAGSGGFVVSPVLGYRAGGFGTNGGPTTTSRVLQAGLGVNGNGAQQTSAIFVMTGNVTNDPVYGWTQAGGFAATARLGASQVSSRAEGAVSSVPSSIKVDANGLPAGSFGTNQNRFDDAPLSQYTAETAVTNAGGSATNYSFAQTSSRTTTPAGLGADHPSALLTAFAGGILQTVTFNPATAARGPASAPFAINGAGQVFLDGNSSRMGAQFLVGATTSSPQFGSAVFDFGSANPNDPTNANGLNTARGTYVDRGNFGARSAAIYDSGANVEASSVVDANANAFANSSSNTATSLSRTGLLMVTANTVGANTSAFLGSISTAQSVTPCRCEYTQWGFWSADTFRTDNANNIAYSDKGNLLFWVAGIPANAADIPTTGSATYSGHAIADISNNTSQYISAGSFTNTVNFATRMGQVQIAGLDSSTYGGTANLVQGSAYFAGSLNTGPSGRNMALVGQFFQGGLTNTTPLYGEMGGTFNITGPNNYLGSGIFVGRKP